MKGARVTLPDGRRGQLAAIEYESVWRRGIRRKRPWAVIRLDDGTITRRIFDGLEIKER